MASDKIDYQVYSETDVYIFKSRWVKTHLYKNKI